ncbi:glucose-6-phosphate isomerase [Candidatus Giovannonibacteria bacterium]|nr:glucose-6-phosphate isomerase [Candidatus Giovannonibacteria bacterium]
MSGKSFIRKASDLSPVLFVPSTDKRAIYEVEREQNDPEEQGLLQKLKIRYDITTIFPGLIGNELPKTFGHYHPRNLSGVAYPEIYEVIENRAWYLIQRPNKNQPKVIEEVYLIETKQNEKALIPPGFGHVTINPENKNLVMANFVANGFDFDYQTYENLRGSAYYLLHADKDELVRLEKNSYYDKVPEIIKLKPKEIPELGITWDVPLYDMIKKPETLDFLIHPEKYLELLTIKNCFTKI